MKKNRNFEVKCGPDWNRVTNAVEVDQGFLHYELKDGTVGLCKPGGWRRFTPVKKEITVTRVTKDQAI